MFFYYIYFFDFIYQEIKILKEIEYKVNNAVNPEKILKKLYGILNEIGDIVGEGDHGGMDLS